MEEPTPEEQAARSTEFFSELVPGKLGCVYDRAAKDLVVGHIDVTPDLIAGTGFLFAPAIVALADTACAIGCGLNTAANESFTTIELKSNFLGSARVGERVTCEARPVHVGARTHVWDAEVTNETRGRTIAVFRCTQMILRPQQPG